MFQPLDRTICADDFKTGLSGWMPLTPNLREDTMDYFPSQRRHTEWGNPMLSTASFGLTGTHGARDGAYSMKIPTRAVSAPAEHLPVAGSLGIALKRLTLPTERYLKFEMWYAFTAEQDRPGLGESAVRAIGFTWDIQDAHHRYFAGARYMNAANGHLRRRWQYLRAAEGDDESWGAPEASATGYGSDGSMRTVHIRRGLGNEHLGRRDDEGGGEGFVDITDGHQTLCYNETADKLNWQYFQLTIDLRERAYIDLASMDQRYDLSACRPTLVEPYPRLNRLMNPLLWIESDTNRRVFLFIDSVRISTSD